MFFLITKTINFKFSSYSNAEVEIKNFFVFYLFFYNRIYFLLTMLFNTYLQLAEIFFVYFF